MSEINQEVTPLRLECIKAEKVYDWVTNKAEHIRIVQVPDDVQAAITAAIDANHIVDISGTLDIADVDSEVVYITYGVQIGEFTVSCVQILKTATATITARDETTGEILGEFPATQQFLEKVALCVPEGLDESNITIKVTKTNFVVFTNRTSINGTILVEYEFCQDIQVEAEVKLQVRGRFCAPRNDTLECCDSESIVCPTPSFPPPCTGLYPPATES